VRKCSQRPGTWKVRRLGHSTWGFAARDALRRIGAFPLAETYRCEAEELEPGLWAVSLAGMGVADDGAHDGR
jgi:hypothetical protein